MIIFFFGVGIVFAIIISFVQNYCNKHFSKKFSEFWSNKEINNSFRKKTPEMKDTESSHFIRVNKIFYSNTF